jgi:Cytochrome c554 and c-prime
MPISSGDCARILFRGFQRSTFHSLGRKGGQSTVLSGVALSFPANVECVSRRALFRLCALTVVFAQLAGGWAAEVKLTPMHEAQFIGAAGCKSSSCHGGAGENRSQYLTWLQQDFHARSYAVLINARSARMAETLALPAAQTSERCTICHSPFQSVAPSRLTTTAQIDEGVSCENCHAAAGRWLRGHTRKDWNYATRVTAGMRDLRNFYVRANTCVACHQNLDLEIAKAGHPELTFELDGQSVSEPEHWRDDNPSSGPRTWLVGQAVALREISWALSRTETPEVETIARWNGLVWLLAKATANQTRLPVIDPPSEKTSRALFAGVQQQADLLARRAAEFPWSDEFSAQILHSLAASDSEFVVSKEESPDLLFRHAERLILALDRLSRAVHHQPPNSATSPELVRLLADVRTRADFEAARFAEHLGSFRATIVQSPP